MAGNRRPPADPDQSKESDGLILYRLQRVEEAVREVNDKLDKQDNIKRTDITDLRDTIIERITDIRADLQKQINAKADKDQVEDLRTLVKAVGSFLSVVMAALVVFYLTNKK